MKHGTPGGYNQHYRKGEKPCEACRQAHRDYVNSRRVRKPRRITLRPHGTLAAYRRHQRKGEKPCQACLAAYNKARADRYIQGKWSSWKARKYERP